MTAPFSLSVAPMMERTDRHFRYLMRLVSPRARLYTEMITSAALLHGDPRRFLAFDPGEHPVAIQLGGCDPGALAAAARLAADAGFDEINLNVGCPSGRVQAGDFGAKLMLEPDRVAECVAAMREATRLPVTVKTRLGVDEHDDYEVLRVLTERLVGAGVAGLIVHARKAWLRGLSPKQNREIPPLDYARVHRLKRDFAALPISINGGFTTEAQVLSQVGKVDGVMLGRGAYHDPLLVGRLDRMLFGADAPAFARGSATVTDVATEAAAEAVATVPPIEEILARYAVYVDRERARGTPLTAMSRHLVGLIAHRPGARRWRQRLSELDADGPGIDALVALLAGMPGGSRYNAGILAPAAVRQSIQVSE